MRSMGNPQTGRHLPADVHVVLNACMHSAAAHSGHTANAEIYAASQQYAIYITSNCAITWCGCGQVGYEFEAGAKVKERLQYNIMGHVSA